MFNNTRIVSLCFQSVITSGNYVCRRNFARKLRVKPLEIVDRGAEMRKERGEITDYSKWSDPEVTEELMNSDMDHDLSLDNVSAGYGMYQEEKRALKLKIQRQRTMRQHFSDFKKHELNVLTVSEKQNIRYLHQTNPEHWTPERLSDAFPISLEGVKRLLRSEIKFRTPESIAKHDKQVKQRIEKLKSGKIPVDPELKEKLALREKIPFSVGALPTNSKELTSYSSETPTRLGEFARLVASPERIRQADEAAARLAEKERKDSTVHKLFVQELKKKNIDRSRPFTLSELEEGLKQLNNTSLSSDSQSNQSSSSSSSSPQLQYLMKLEARAGKIEPVEVSEIIPSDSSDPQNFTGKLIQKFKAQGGDGKGEGDSPRLSVNAESGEAYLYSPKTGYQKPFASKLESPDRIEIPLESRKPGATYKVGDSYYDEDGEFLYRVI